MGAFQIFAGSWDTNRGGAPWAVSPPTTCSQPMQQLYIHRGQRVNNQATANSISLS